MNTPTNQPDRPVNRPEASSGASTGDPQARSHRGLVMTAVFIATFMTSVEMTIVTTALPTIITSLNALTVQSWIMSTYMLTTAISTPLWGKIADTVGRKQALLWGVAAFTVGSALSGLAPDIGLLIAGRAIQGIGAGAVMPLTFTVIADFYDFAHRSRMIAFNNTAWGLSALLGPVLGGFLVDALSWHWVFFVNVPLGVVVLALVWLAYHGPATPHVHARVDWAGIFWLTCAVVTLMVGIQNLETQPVVGAVLLVVSALAWTLLVRTERRAADALIPPAMFASRTFAVQIVTAMILSGVLIGYQTYLPMWLQSLYGSSPTVAGLVVTPSSVLWLAGSFMVGGLISRHVPKWIALIGVGMLLVAYGVLALAPADFPVWGFFVFAALNGAAMGIVISMNTVLSQHLVPDRMVGSATGLFTLGRSLGPTVLAGIYGAVLNVTIRQQLTGASATAAGVGFEDVNRVISTAGAPASGVDRAIIDPILLSAFHAVFLVAVLVLLVAVVINLTDPNKRVIR